MIKIEKYTGTKTYMFPNGGIAAPQTMEENFPAIAIFPHIIETDAAGQMCYAVENLAAIRSLLNIDPDLTDDEAIAAIEVLRNTPPKPAEPTAEERIAAAMEFQNLLML